jgi:hypothetical protein
MSRDASTGLLHQRLIASQKVVLVAVEYISLRDGLMNGHRSKEGRKLNEAVKAYLQAIQSH